MPNRRVVVTGLGTVSPIGNDVETAWSAALDGTSGAGPIQSFDPLEFRTKFAAEVKGFEPLDYLGRKEARRMDRFTQFSVISSGEALKQANLESTEENRDRIGVIMGTGIGGIGTIWVESQKFFNLGPRKLSPFMVPMMLADAASTQVAIKYGLRGPNMAVVTACASSANAIGEAYEIIRRDAADAMLAGGSEAGIVPISVAGFNVIDAISTRNDDPGSASRPFDKERDGFVLGEGGASIVIESLEFAEARGATILAELTGYASNDDAFHITAPVANGVGAAGCMMGALESANLKPDDIQYINAHGTSTPLNDPSETAAIKRVFGEAAYDIPVSSTKSMTGHMLGAAGAIESIFCVKALEYGRVPPTINYEYPDPECDLDYVPNEGRDVEMENVMTNSFGFGGHNATLIFSKYRANGNGR